MFQLSGFYYRVWGLGCMRPAKSQYLDPETALNSLLLAAGFRRILSMASQAIHTVAPHIP